MFDLEGVSRIRCGDICLGESCCKGFMYDENSQRCVGVHFGDFDYTAKLNITFSFIDGMLPYQKGILSIFISHLCFRSRSLSLSRARARACAHTRPLSFLKLLVCFVCLEEFSSNSRIFTHLETSPFPEKVCRGWDSNTKPCAFGANALTHGATAASFPITITSHTSYIYVY